MIKSLNIEECELVLSLNYIGHLAYIYKDKPFVVPVTYFYANNRIICYSGDGHKVNALRLHNAAALEVAEITSIDNWKSVVAHGTYIELERSSAKAMLHEFSLGVKDVILRKEQRDLDFISEFSAKIDSDEKSVVFVIDIKEFTGVLRHN
ncbi:pyridoxamine 5'-phosphate oxidase family protein [Winogradskyella psychrotolerans]|uniref:pyridoxamine 5'-phosphate oxidase family protein n=1 Tax=Winogradskyella psychrotolerans TaxID=1344585 RepID=UPI001C06861F|nr:pyridoxamine 5'-phosphate oxidase family protein [Winogradskyella psychrotolerans]MBU2927909.1 pyridoxamine 5'-phosphate oxidase family protein [Winogradskyella psychrotolerans]